MRFNVIINQDKCLKNGLNVNQAALMALFNELSSWATERVFDGKMYWHISRGKVIQELPLFYSKPDTVYRHFRDLDELKLIEYRAENRKDYVRLTVKGKLWNKLGNESEFAVNSEINPSKLGNESEFLKPSENADNVRVVALNSEIVPTDNFINNKTIDESNALAYLESEKPSAYELFMMRFRNQFTDAEFLKFVEIFNATVSLEVQQRKLEFTAGQIEARLKKFVLNYIDNMKRPGSGTPQNENQDNHPTKRRLG